MGLREALLSTPVELGPTADRYDFQAFWGLILVLEKHASGIDYAVAFEFHDDIVLLDSPVDPKEVKFYQVKTRNPSLGKWTVARLTEREKIRKGAKGKSEKKGEPEISYAPSIAGKLFANYQKFKDYTAGLCVVSNQVYDFLDCGETDRCLKECEKDSLDEFLKALRFEYPEATIEEANLFHFRKTGLSLDDASSHIRGKIHNFLLGEGVGGSYNFQAVSDGLLDQCALKSKQKGPFDSLEKIVERKAVSRATVEGWLDEVRKVTLRDLKWSDVEPSIIDMVPIRRRKIRQQWDKYSIESLKPAAPAMHEAREIMRAAIENISDDEAVLSKIMERTSASVSDRVMSLIGNHPMEYIQAMFLREWHAS